MRERPRGRLLFWGAAGLIGYTYAGFPLLVALRALLFPRPVAEGPDQPPVTLVVAAHNEEAVIARKIENSLTLDYPADRLTIIVASDGSDDDTVAVARSVESGRVIVMELPRAGKNATLNAAVDRADGEILLFTDADTMLEPDALSMLVRCFSDPEVGGVGGDYRHTDGEGRSAGEGAYWSFDRRLRQLQARSGTMTSAGGGIFAIRRSLFRPIPSGVSDDFYTSVQVPAGGKRLVFESRSVAYGPIAVTQAAEFQRKVRIISTGLRGVLSVRRALDPRTHGFFAVQLLTHKGLRRLMAFPLVALYAASLRARTAGGLYRVAALLQTGLYGAGLAGWLLRGHPAGRSRLLALPAYFAMVNVASVVAVWKLLSGAREDVWVPDRGESASEATR